MTVGPRGRPAHELDSQTFPRIAIHRSSRGYEALTIVRCVPKHRRGRAPSTGNRPVEMTQGVGREWWKGLDGLLRGTPCEPRYG